MSVNIKQIEIDVNIHVTEDLSKIKSSLLFLLSEGFNFQNAKIQKLIGAYENSIQSMNIIISERNFIDFFLSSISKSLSENDKIFLAKNFSKFINPKNILYIRFRKDNLFHNLLHEQFIETDPSRQITHIKTTRIIKITSISTNDSRLTKQ